MCLKPYIIFIILWTSWSVVNSTLVLTHLSRHCVSSTSVSDITYVSATSKVQCAVRCRTRVDCSAFIYTSTSPYSSRCGLLAPSNVPEGSLDCEGKCDKSEIHKDQTRLPSPTLDVTSSCHCLYTLPDHFNTAVFCVANVRCADLGAQLPEVDSASSLAVVNSGYPRVWLSAKVPEGHRDVEFFFWPSGRAVKSSMWGNLHNNDVNQNCTIATGNKMIDKHCDGGSVKPYVKCVKLSVHCSACPSYIGTDPSYQARLENHYILG